MTGSVVKEVLNRRISIVPVQPSLGDATVSGLGEVEAVPGDGLGGRCARGGSWRAAWCLPVLIVRAAASAAAHQSCTAVETCNRYRVSENLLCFQLHRRPLGRKEQEEKLSPK